MHIMKNIEDINRENVKKILASKKYPQFFPGDIVKVGVRITEGKRERIQYFEGVCIGKKNRNINSSFTVRKISFACSEISIPILFLIFSEILADLPFLSLK